MKPWKFSSTRDYWRLSVYLPYPLKLIIRTWARMQPLNSKMDDNTAIREIIYQFGLSNKNHLIEFMDKNSIPAKDREILNEFLNGGNNYSGK